MEGLFGLSDIAWSGISKNVGLLMAVACGLLIPFVRRWRSEWNRRIFGLCLGILLGELTNCVANGWMLEGGPDAFVGGVILPIEYGIVVMIVHDIARRVGRLWSFVHEGRT